MRDARRPAGRRKRPRPPCGAPDLADFVEAAIPTPSFQSLRTLSSLWRPQRAVKGQALDCALGRPPLRESVSRSDRSREVDVTRSHQPFVCRTVPSAFIAGGYITGSFLRAPSRSACAYWNIRSECVGGASYRTATASSMSRSPTDPGPPIDVSAARAADRCNGGHPTLKRRVDHVLSRKDQQGRQGTSPCRPYLITWSRVRCANEYSSSASRLSCSGPAQGSRMSKYGDERGLDSFMQFNVGEIASAARECSRRKMLLPPGSLHYRCPTASTASRPASLFVPAAVFAVGFPS